MGFRDDREAQFRRAEALARENRELRDALRERDAEPAGDDDAEQVARLERENARLRRRLDAAGGPGLARRVVRRLASLSLPQAAPQPGYARAVALTWRLYAGMVPAFAIPAAVYGRPFWLALAVYATATPIAVTVVALGARGLGATRVQGAAAAGLVIGIVAMGTVAWSYSTSILGDMPAGEAIAARRAVPLGACLYACVASLHLLGATHGREHYWWIPFAPVFALPLPHYVFAIGAFRMWGGRLVDPSYLED